MARSMIARQNIKLNLVPGGVPPVLNVSQNDSAYDVHFTLYNGAQLFEIPDDVTIQFVEKKRDGNGYDVGATKSAQTGQCYIWMQKQMTAVPGDQICELILTNTTEDQIGTANFIMRVEPGPVDDDTSFSDSDIAYANQVLAQLGSVAAYKAQLDAQGNEIDQLNTNLAAEVAARQAADNTLQSNINSEASTRATADAALQSQINQLIAPEGAAPSAAEVENARVGADGTVYQTLGDAIRGQVTDVKTAISNISGTEILIFEDGYIDIPNVGTVVSLTRTAYTDRKSAYARVSVGQPVAINVIGVGTTSAGGRAYAFLDENLKVLSRASANETVNTTLYAPSFAAYVVVNTRTDTISDYYAYVGLTGQGAKLSETEVAANTALVIVNSIVENEPYELGDLAVLRYWIDLTNSVIDSSASVPERLVVIPVANGQAVHVSIPKTSTKRVAFCDRVADGSTAYSATEISGALNAAYVNTENHKYLVIQLFINSDTDKNYVDYLSTAEISVLSAVDTYARRLIDGGYFVSENLKGLPILNSFSDIEIITSAYDDCAAFHALVKSELCDTSNGYLVQSLLGTDGHGNNLYKYITNPATVKYGADRRFGTPDYPITGGYAIHPFTVIITSNIHGIEHGGNWVVYNLLKKMQTPNTDMLRFFRNSVKIIWVPYICPSGDYENADGVNINRDFPSDASGTCTSPEATLVKAVIDQYAPDADLHIDIHTFNTTGSYAQYFSSWTFTDSSKLGLRSANVSKSVVDRYADKYPTINILQREVVSAVNTPTTCTYYTQTVYGIPAGTIEGALQMDGSPTGADSHTSATAYLYDIITQVICAMAS